MPQKILLAWSGGKDSAMSLYEVQKSRAYDVAALLTTITDGYDRISMHGVRRELLERQAESLGVNLHKIYIPIKSTNEQYQAAMKATLEHYLAQGIRSVAFGDLFLEDIKKYREENLAKVGMKGIFPVWLRDTREFARTFLDLGFKAVTVCVDPKHLDPSFVGKEIDESFLDRLPPGVDPCGENGEFHTFVYDGPIFQQPIRFRAGEPVERDSFWFCDLLPEA